LAEVLVVAVVVVSEDFLEAEAALAVVAVAARGRCNPRVYSCVLLETNYAMKPVLLSTFLFLAISVFAQDKDFHLDKEYAISKNGTIDLNSSDAEVIITGSARSATARVKIDRTVTTKGWYTSKGDFRVDVIAENGDLKITEHQNGINVVMIGYIHEEYKIQIEAPEGASLVIRGDDGDYFIKNINGVISMTIDDGDSQLTGCGGSDFTFKIDDGDVKMDAGKGSLHVVADDGDIEILNAAFSTIDARLDDGDFILHTSLTNSGVYSINVEDGMVMLDVLDGGGEFNVRHDDAHVDVQGSFKTIEDSDDFTRLTLGSSTAKVNIRADDASVRLNAGRK
jgi:Putative adhesin